MHVVLAGQQSFLGLSESAVGYTGLVVLFAAVVAFVALFVGALVSILKARMDGGMKLVWVVFAFIAPILGSLLWFLIGRRHLTTYRSA
ncbi:PLD nuclease N-terminal domain-containing protein [Streptomyces sp. NPDC093097]|uniref:PLD nuclease N-terminal domain-containing protein n=1 Tax=Streptomyces sp. NPDC093097 TaxID=3366027 RepID=UPI0037F9B453